MRVLSLPDEPMASEQRLLVCDDGCGRLVGYASNLVATDTNGKADVFMVPRP
jgi:hypothetical protein